MDNDEGSYQPARHKRDDRKKRKKEVMRNLVARNLRKDKKPYERPGRFGRTTTDVEMFLPDSDDNRSSKVIGMSWTLIESATNKYEAVALYASAVGVFVPTILETLIPPLEERAVRIHVIGVPYEAEELGYTTDYGDLYSYEEILVNIGLSLILPFKNISEKNYSGFINARKKALGGIIGMTPSEITRHKFPLDLEKALMVQRVLTGNREVKQQILKYLMWASDEATGCLKTMARYVSSILAWNEMNILVFINNVFVNSKSPVLEAPEIQDEVNNYVKAMVNVIRSPCPQFFRYFCSGPEEQLLHRKNFPTLGAAAQELLNRKSNNRSLENFVGTAARGAELVERLVKLHEEFCKETVASNNVKSLKFLFDKVDYAQLLEEEEEED